MKNFIEQATAGDVALNEIDDWVERWHDDQSITESLQSYLGLTDVEYNDWAKTDAALVSIVAARKNAHKQ